MKKITLWLTAAMLTVAAGGCNTFLDPAPVDRQPGENYLTTSNNVEAVLVSAYDALQGGNFYGGQLQRVGALYGDDFDLANVASQQFVSDFVTRSFGIFNGPGESLWTSGYTAIFRSNVVIKSINDNTATDATAADNTRRKGEALFIRGLAHFELLRFFALPYTADPNKPGIVLRTFPANTEEAAQPIARASVGEVYTQIIADLQQAIQLLPANNNIGRANKLAAQAILARVYFNQADYNNAFTAADQAITAATTAGITLGTPDSAGVVGPFRTVGAVQAPGTLFQIGNSAADDATGDLRNIFYSGFGSPTLPVLTTPGGAYALYEAGDLRKRYLFGTDPGDPTSPIPNSLKFQGSDPVNVPIIRLAELYLTRAESRVQKGGFNAADVRADLNAVRTAAGLPADNITTAAADLLTKIRNERRVELLTENDRFHELRRLRSTNIRGRSYDDSSALLKIPASETSANTAIVQN
jgi:tetratricopeptide (TPR) repeat protein